MQTALAILALTALPDVLQNYSIRVEGYIRSKHLFNYNV